MARVIPDGEVADVTVPSADDAPDGKSLESRWPPVAAVLGFLTLNVGLRLWLPEETLVGVHWLMPAIELLLIFALLAADPGRLPRRPLWVRAFALPRRRARRERAVATDPALPPDHRCPGDRVTGCSSLRVRSSGSATTSVFALLYWLIDNGGSVARHQGAHAYLDFAFTQHMSPELAPPGWRPVFADYLHLVADHHPTRKETSRSRSTPLSLQ